jgi:tetratricopeptide (TPR) repeat protein
LLWGFADWALVAKFVYAAAGQELALPLYAMQGTAVAVAGWLAFALWRRRFSAVAKARPQHFRAGLTAYLRSDLDGAGRVFRRLLRCNPWDAAAWLALGNVERRAGRAGAARRCYRRARAVDRAADYQDLARQQEARLVREPGLPALRPAVTTVGPAPTPRRSRQAGS